MRHNEVFQSNSDSSFGRLEMRGGCIYPSFWTDGSDLHTASLVCDNRRYFQKERRLCIVIIIFTVVISCMFAEMLLN